MSRQRQPPDHQAGDPRGHGPSGARRTGGVQHPGRPHPQWLFRGGMRLFVSSRTFGDDLPEMRAKESKEGDPWGSQDHWTEDVAQLCVR